MLPKALSALAATALAGATLVVPSSASATTDRDLRWSVQGSRAVLTHRTTQRSTSPTSAGRPTRRRTSRSAPPCSSPCTAHRRAARSGGRRVSPRSRATAPSTPRWWCCGRSTGPSRTAAEVGLLFRDPINGTPTFQHVRLEGLADPRAEVAISVNATPEPVKKDRTITVKGTVTRNGKAYSGKKATLYFARDNRQAVKIKPVTTSSKGALRTTVKASRSGRFFWVTGSTSKTQQGTSGVDRVKVK